MLTGKEKATVLLSIIGPQKAARLLRQLPEDVSNFLAAKVATLPTPSTDMVNKVLAELSSNIIEAPKDVKVIESMSDVVESKGDDSSAKSMTNGLSGYHATKIADAIKGEKHRLLSFIISLLDEDKAKEVKSIIDLDVKQRLELVKLEETPILKEIKPAVINIVKKKIEA